MKYNLSCSYSKILEKDSTGAFSRKKKYFLELVDGNINDKILKKVTDIFFKDSNTYEIKKIEQLLLSDAEIIQIREKIIKSSDVQLKNGVITSSEYLIELTNLFEAKNILKTHEVQLAAAKSNYEIIKGK